MSIGDLPLFGMLKSRLQWHQARQKVLAENVANADMPGYRRRDVKMPSFEALSGGTASNGVASVKLAGTQPGHIGAIAGGGIEQNGRESGSFETTPSGNGVNIEDEMLAVAQNQMDYQAMTQLYAKNLQLMKMAVGKGR